MNAFKVGLMALAAMSAVVYMSIKVTSNQSGFGDYVTYRTIISDASGIFPKTPIKVAGINAGRIKKIELQGNNALITFEVLEDVVITKDSRLKIKSVGFLGDKYLEISVGQSKERLPVMSFVISVEGGGLENIVKDASEVLKDVKVVVKGIKDAMAPEGKPSPVKKIMDDLSELADNTKQATASIKRIMDTNEEKINKMIANLEKFSDDLQYQIDNKNHDSAMADVKDILANAKKMTSDLEQIVADIKQGKGTVGKLLRDEKIVDEVSNTLAGVNRLVGRVNMIRTELEMFTGANTLYGAETFANFKIYPSPERFYMFGLVTSEFGPDDERRIITTVNGQETVRDEIVRDKDSFRFNFQFGRQFNNWTVRAGLIETTGGLGFDYQLHTWNQKFSLEVFDYRDEIGPNLRLSSELQIWNIFYGRVALEDTLEDSRSATFSAGLRFTDEDIRALVAMFVNI